MTGSVFLFDAFSSGQPVPTWPENALQAADVAQDFLSTLMGLKAVKQLLSSDHFSVDGTLIDAWRR